MTDMFCIRVILVYKRENIFVFIFTVFNFLPTISFQIKFIWVSYFIYFHNIYIPSRKIHDTM